MKDEEKEKIKILTETLKMISSEFENLSKSLKDYIESNPKDPEGAYFRIRFMQQVCSDLLEVLKSKKIDENIINGTEIALCAYKKIYDKMIGDNIL